MKPSITRPVLLIGGSGVVGAWAAGILRRLHPDLPIAIGGRDLKRAEATAAQTGGARAVRIDLERADLAIAPDDAPAAIALFVKDDTLNSMRYAQQAGVPYVDISTGPFEIAPAVALFVHQPAAAPVLLASNWLAGTATLSALLFAREQRHVEAIEIAAVLDEQDMGGPAAYADYERLTAAAPSALILENGSWRWIAGEGAGRRFKDVDGVELQGTPYSMLDVVSLAAATTARSIRFDLAIGESASRRRGEPFSTEIIIEIAGRNERGAAVRARHELVHPAGQAPLTALGVAVAIERLLGLAGGGPAAPGLYLPHVLIDPAHMMERLRAFGARIRETPA
jgi:hypothetical protein